MTDPRDYIIETAQGQRSITIEPVIITLDDGILYATGVYGLKEGNVGVGTITFTPDENWTFDGFSDINETDITQIARYIKRLRQHHVPGDGGNDQQATPATLPMPQQATSKSLTIIVEDKGKPVDVRIEMNYPFYDISVAGKTAAQLEQDHHSNWFVTKGHLDDGMVQEIGRRITQYISAA